MTVRNRSTSPDARSVALDTLTAVEKGKHADTALRSALEVLADVRDRGLAMELCYGVLRWRLRLDGEILPRLRGKTDARLLNILRLGLYQLRFLERVPAHAAVHAAVEQTKMIGLKHAAGLVNAVMRGLQRQGEPDWPRDSSPASLALRYAHPEWLVRRWVSDYGVESTEGLLAADQQIPLHGIRIRRGEAEEAAAWFRAQGLSVDTCSVAPACLRVAGGGDSQLWPGVVAGNWVLQDEAAQAMVRLLPPADTHLDLCAAPGGKSFLLADRDPDARIYAVDKSERRVAEMRGLRDHLGLEERIELVRGDAESPVAEGRLFPSVLVDAPCSSLGTLRRNPDRKWREPPEPGLPETQRSILRQAALQTAPGGHLLYVTCTLWRAENEEVAHAFEAEHGGADGQFERVSLPEHPFLTDEGFYQSRPDIHGTDGFFGALWRRR